MARPRSIYCPIHFSTRRIRLRETGEVEKSTFCQNTNFISYRTRNFENTHNLIKGTYQRDERANLATVSSNTVVQAARIINILSTNEFTGTLYIYVMVLTSSERKQYLVFANSNTQINLLDISWNVLYSTFTVGRSDVYLRHSDFSDERRDENINRLTFFSSDYLRA